MNIQFVPVTDKELPQYKHDMKQAFQKGAEAEFGSITREIMPERYINKVLKKEGCVPYMALVEGDMVGGAVVTIDPATQHNHLEMLYVKHGTQSKGIGQAMWTEIQRLYPETKVWELYTPYFEKRNIHFYVNKCGFRIVEFFCEHHQYPFTEEEEKDDDPGTPGYDFFFRFEKHMNP